MQIKDVAPSYGIAIAVAIPVWALNLLPVSEWIKLLVQLVAGLFLLYYICEITKTEEYFETKGVLLSFVKKTKTAIGLK